MSVQSWRARRAIACGAFSLSILAGPMLFAGSAAAQAASAHDAAVAAAATGDYIAAADLAKQAAAAGQPLDPDQLDFITGKAAKQQASLDEAAKLKANQQAAALTAQQIMDRTQKDYKTRAQQAADRANQCAQQAAAASIYAQAQGGAAGQALGAGSLGSPRTMNAQAAPVSNEHPGGTC